VIINERESNCRQEAWGFDNFFVCASRARHVHQHAQPEHAVGRGRIFGEHVEQQAQPAGRRNNSVTRALLGEIENDF